MDAELRRCLKKHISGRSNEILSCVDDLLSNGIELNMVSSLVPKQLGLHSLESEAKCADGINKGIKEYELNKYREEQSNRKVEASDLLYQLLDYLKILKKDIGNAYFFNLGKAEYTPLEIKQLNNLLNACMDAHSIGFRSKIPDCDPDNCDKCILHNRKGCKKDAYPERFERWISQ